MAMRRRIGTGLIGVLATAAVQAANWTVTDTGDTGDGTCDASCTMRDAVNAAQEDDRIQFDLALPTPIVIGLTGTALQIDVPIRIIATDGVRTALRRVSGTGRLIELSGAADARIIGLDFENGSTSAFAAPARGGGVFIAAGTSLELRDCTFRDNSAIGSNGSTFFAVGTAHGGAIHSDGDLLLENCAFVNNTAVAGDGTTMRNPPQTGGDAEGGAISATGSVGIVNTTFHGNEARGGKGGNGDMVQRGIPGDAGADGGDARGGAVFWSDTATVSIAFSTLIGNHVTGGAGGIGGAGDPPGADGVTGDAAGPAIHAGATGIIESSVVADHTGSACSGTALTARTSNRVADASCPGLVVAALETQFEAINTDADSPHYLPFFDAVVVDAAADCLDAVAFEAVVLDQLLTPRPQRTTATSPRCDIGAIELNPVLFGDGFEEPPPPP